jgi:hypothetical protein
MLITISGNGNYNGDYNEQVLIASFAISKNDG